MAAPGQADDGPRRDGDQCVRHSWVLTLGLLGAFASHSPSVSAQQPSPAPVQVRFELTRDEAASVCPGSEQLQSAVAARLGYVPFANDAPRTVTVQISRSARGLSASLQVRGADPTQNRERTLASKRRGCGDLAEALVLAISLAIDPLALSRPASTEPAPTPLPEPVPEPAPPLPVVVIEAPPAPTPPPPAAVPAPTPLPPPAPTAPPTLDPTLWPTVSLGVHAVVGAEPGGSLGANLAIGIRSRALAVAIEARIDAARSLDVAPVGQVQVAMRGVGVSGCALVHGLAMCGLGQLLIVAAEGRGAPQARSALGVLATIGARVGYRWALSRQLWLQPGVELHVALDRIDLVWLDAVVWSSSRVQALAVAAIGADL